MITYDQKERIKLERSILGACLLEGGFDQVNDILLHSDFLKPNNLIYTAMLRLHEANEEIDLLTVTRFLEKKKQPVQPYYIAECTLNVHSWTNISRWGLLLLEYNLDDDLNKICKKYVSGDNLDAQLASNCCQKIIEYADPLKTMDLVSAYLFKRSPESQFTKEIISLNQKFNDRCHRIRQNMKK